MKSVSDMSSQELFEEARGLYCFEISGFRSVPDMMRYGIIQQELQNRGFDLKETRTLELIQVEPRGNQ